MTPEIWYVVSDDDSLLLVFCVECALSNQGYMEGYPSWTLFEGVAQSMVVGVLRLARYEEMLASVTSCDVLHMSEVSVIYRNMY